MMIGELATRLGVTTKTLRLYEQRGLIPAAARAANGYRF
jgi:MerR family transcriptional regulator, copper efflux regulator